MAAATTSGYIAAPSRSSGQTQSEIDTVVVNSMRPKYVKDRPPLPCAEAILGDMLSWNPVIPLSQPGIPHTTSSEDTTQGYLIPKGLYLHIQRWISLTLAGT
ncbi:hypothetical protein EV424DRAFT_1516323 [Suillus variegatus]|nr:hypothetical protein EV424DRAFT_1516323 [Suillus variegatus]